MPNFSTGDRVEVVDGSDDEGRQGTVTCGYIPDTGLVEVRLDTPYGDGRRRVVRWGAFRFRPLSALHLHDGAFSLEEITGYEDNH